MGERLRVRLGEVADVSWGDTNTTKAAYTPSGYPAFSATGQDGFLPYADYSGPGVVISAIGAQCGRSWLARGNWSCIKNTIRIVARDDRLDIEFLHWLLQAKDIWPKRGSAQPFISQTDARDVLVELPPVSEQRGIAEVLGALDDKIEANRAIAERVERLATALPASAVASTTVGLVAGFGRKLVSTAHFAGQDVEHFSLPAFDANRRPVVENGDGIKSGKFLLEGPTVLVSKLNPHIPRVWMATPTGTCPAITSTEFVGLVPTNDYPVEVLWSLCASTEFSSQLTEMVKGTTGSHQRVSADDVLRLKVPDPRALRSEVIEIITAAVRLAGMLRNESVRLATLRDTLLPKLLTGELRVRMPPELVGRAV